MAAAVSLPSSILDENITLQSEKGIIFECQSTASQSGQSPAASMKNGSEPTPPISPIRGEPITELTIDDEPIMNSTMDSKASEEITPPLCNVHNSVVDMNARVFCLDCHQTLTETEKSEHISHNLIPVEESLATQKMQTDTLMQSTIKSLVEAEDWKEHISNMHKQLVSKRKAIAVQLDHMFSELEHKLQERKMDLFTTLTDISYSKECYLENQLDYMISVIDKLKSLKQNITELEKTSADGNLISHNHNELSTCEQELSSHRQPLDTYCISENTHLQFEPRGLLDVRKSLHSLGRIISSSVLPCKCSASGDGIKKCAANKQTQVKLTLRDKNANIVRDRDVPVSVELFNENVHVTCQCSENGNGTHTILYIAPEPGIYQLSIKVFNQHIKNSPFNVKSNISSRITSRSMVGGEKYRLTRLHEVKPDQPIKRVSPNKSMPIRVTSPRSVCSADSYSSLRILPKSPTSHPDQIPEPPCGDYLSLIGKFGRKLGQLSNPQGVTVDSDSRVYVSDSTNQNVQVFSEDGTYIKHIGARGREPGQLLRPIGMNFTKDGSLIFSDYENKCVNVFKDGKFTRRIGTGKLIGPKGVCVSPRGSILVADNKGNQVLEFSFQGRLLRTIKGDRKKPESLFAGPHYVALDQTGNILVTDFHKHCVRVFSREGVYLKQFGTHGTDVGEFNAPTGISIDEEGRILVADWGNSRIQVFDELGNFLTLVDTSSAPLFGPQSVTALPDERVAVCDSGHHCVKIFKYRTGDDI